MRIQKKNFFDYSWKSNPNAVYVGRPSKWGNPFKVAEFGVQQSLKLFRLHLQEKLRQQPDFLEPLRGKDLVCFCKLTDPCHADIISEFLTLADKEVKP